MNQGRVAEPVSAPDWSSHLCPRLAVSQTPLRHVTSSYQ
jgi:hypothetical protein